MRLSFTVFPALVGILILNSALPAAAVDPRVEALGGASLVLEEETTVLSLFNLGNPAGAAFLPQQSRSDQLVSLNQRERLAEFTTGAAGTSAVINPYGNTLEPYALYTRQSSTLDAALNDWGQTGYGGFLVWLNDGLVTQFIPRADGSRLRSTDNPYDSARFFGGGTVRAAWLPADNWSVGAGIDLGNGRSSEWVQPDWTASLDGNTSNPRSEFSREETRLGGEAGAAWRLENVFDSKDRLDLGLRLAASRPSWTERTNLHGETDGPILSSFQTDAYSIPAEVQLQGIYTYQSKMDVALVTGWQTERLYRAVTGGDVADQPEYLAHILEHFNYELSLRLRLPMVREDDLRFGIVFNNRGSGNPYPDGRWLSYAPDGSYAQAPIETASSAIGIGTAIVPQEGSIFTLEYFLGSSKSRQESAIVANTGFNRFNVGAQYALLEGLFLRLGYSNERVAYQTENETTTTQAVTVTRSTETNALRFGVGVGDGPWRVDLTLIAERVTHSPDGWTMLDKPIAVTTDVKDTDQRLSGLLGFTWVY